MNIRYSSLHPLSFFFFFFALKIHIHTQVIYFFFLQHFSFHKQHNKLLWSSYEQKTNGLRILSVPKSSHAMETFEHCCISSTACFASHSPLLSCLNTTSKTSDSWWIEQKALLVSGEGWLRWQQRTNMGLLNARMWTDTQTHLISIIFCDIH